MLKKLLSEGYHSKRRTIFLWKKKIHTHTNKIWKKQAHISNMQIFIKTKKKDTQP